MKNISQLELAEHIGVGKATISKIMKMGTGYPTFSNLDKIARYFNATATQLFGTELEIQLEIGHDTIDEYVKKATVILEARNAIPEILSFQEKINNMVRSEKFE
jgi:transcriptional regulator with XRE-family HTH domain